MRMRFSFLLLACVSLVVTPLAPVGCSSPQRTVYVTAQATHVSVQEAMRLWGAYVAAKHPPVEQEIRVKDAFDKYVASMKLVADAGKTTADASSTNSTTASAVLSALKANADRDLDDLVSLLRSFGVKI